VDGIIAANKGLVAISASNNHIEEKKGGSLEKTQLMVERKYWSHQTAGGGGGGGGERHPMEKTMHGYAKSKWQANSAVWR